jgi:hypothetical protein
VIPFLVPGHGDGISHPAPRVGTHVNGWRVTGFWTHGTTRFAFLAQVDRPWMTRTVTVARLEGLA